MGVNYLETIPGSERIIVSRKSGSIDLSKVVLDIEHSVDIQIVRKLDSSEYEIEFDIKGFGFGQYNDCQIFSNEREAIKEQDKILKELKKGKNGQYKLFILGKDNINLYLT